MMLMSALVLVSALGCNKEKPAEQQKLAPVASAPLEAAMPRAASALAFAVDEASSNFTFLMDGALEKLDGQAPQSISGELYVDPGDLSKSTALVKADLNKLTLFQQKRADEKEAYSERNKSDLQNKHARGWLELDTKEGEVTAAQAEGNRFAELKILKLENASANDVTKLSGAERKVTATVSGDFRLHGRKATKSAKVELTFKYAGDKLDAVEVKTLEPFVVALEEFEVHPRDAAGKLVKKISEAVTSNLKGKVAAEAPISVSFLAKAK
jgi:polyisoprenoid-binding protein YceI